MAARRETGDETGEAGMNHHQGMGYGARKRRGPPTREALMFHAVFLAPTMVIAALAALELAVYLWQWLP